MNQFKLLTLFIEGNVFSCWLFQLDVYLYAPEVNAILGWSLFTVFAFLVTTPNPPQSVPYHCTKNNKIITRDIIFVQHQESSVGRLQHYTGLAKSTIWSSTTSEFCCGASNFSLPHVGWANIHSNVSQSSQKGKQNQAWHCPG